MARTAGRRRFLTGSGCLLGVVSLLTLLGVTAALFRVRRAQAEGSAAELQTNAAPFAVTS